MSRITNRVSTGKEAQRMWELPLDEAEAEGLLQRGVIDEEVYRRVERFGCRATESFESLHIRIRSKFGQNSEKYQNYSSKILKN